ncbi:hypothetical protein ACH4SP_25840 [Streptomyces sp. NPDC021093]|uniref:hypothetical protein n=1 Tax=Streptomyces sp. NPDC021093 TaxID=3365112 RepID=UPI0037B30D81
MAGDSDRPKSEVPEDGGPPRVRGESRRTVRDALLVGTVQALMAGLAEEAAHWIVQYVVWLCDMLASFL